MPTSVTLDDELAAALQQRAEELDEPLERVAQDILRRGLEETSETSDPQASFKIRTFSSGVKPKFAHLTPNEILGVLDDEYYEKKLQQ